MGGKLAQVAPADKLKATVERIVSANDKNYSDWLAEWERRQKARFAKSPLSMSKAKVE